MLNHVLLPVDGTSDSEQGLKLATRFLSRSESGTLTLLRAVAETRGSHRETAMSEAQHELSGLRDRIETRGLKISTRVVAGDPAQVISECALQTRPDLVAMATHARTGVDRLLSGSVTEGVLRTCDSPLLVGNLHGLNMAGGKAPFHRILVPLDGSEVAATILPLVERVAQLFGSDVILQRIERKDPGEDSRRHQEIEGYLDHFAQALMENGVNEAKIMLRFGDPASAILEAVDELRCDLVAMSSHGRTGLARLRFGSVAEQVLRACPAPLLLRRAALPGA
jgi:nucleotide-binding universal stress UspA family protein